MNRLEETVALGRALARVRPSEVEGELDSAELEALARLIIADDEWSASPDFARAVVLAAFRLGLVCAKGDEP